MRYAGPEEVDPVEGEQIGGGGRRAPEYEARLVGAGRCAEGRWDVGPASARRNVDGAEHRPGRRVLVKFDPAAGSADDAVAERVDSLEVHFVPADRASVSDRADLLVAAHGVGGRGGNDIGRHPADPKVLRFHSLE